MPFGVATSFLQDSADVGAFIPDKEGLCVFTKSGKFVRAPEHFPHKRLGIFPTADSGAMPRFLILLYKT
jgi:hypothetical protein